MNPAKKSEYNVHTFPAQKFSTVQCAKKTISQLLVGSVTDFGYIIPGHGLKGKHQIIKDDSDLRTMYAIYHGKRQITIWCTGKLNPATTITSKKRAHQVEEGTIDIMPKAKTAKIMLEVQVIMKKLQDKHGSKYSIKQYSAWAHMLQIESHKSYEEVPDLAYFGRNPKRVSQSPGATWSLSHLEPPGASGGQPPAIPVAPSRSECIDELTKWHALFEKGAITKQQYDNRQSKILADISKH